MSVLHVLHESEAVSLHVVLPREPLVAHVTERDKLRAVSVLHVLHVSEAVSLHVVLPREPLVAHVTLVLLLARVYPHVTLEVSRAQKHLTASRAHLAGEIQTCH